ncbi:MAG: methyltransferase domain-containing protein [Planctomycetaceae bacterium]
MLPRILEVEAMDTPLEARDYDTMDHSTVNRVFVSDLIPWLEQLGDSEDLYLLDVGTGTAQIPIELCRRFDRCSVRAVDLAIEMLKIGHRNVDVAGLTDRIVLQQEDAKRLSYPENQFDAVVSNSIIHHIPEPLRALGEIKRVLRRGGVYFVRDLCRPETLELVDHIVNTYAGQENAHQQQMFRDSLHAALTVDDVRAMLRELSLPEEWVQMTSDRHWTIAGRKPA